MYYLSGNNEPGIHYYPFSSQHSAQYTNILKSKQKLFQSTQERNKRLTRRLTGSVCNQRKRLPQGLWKRETRLKLDLESSLTSTHLNMATTFSRNNYTATDTKSVSSQLRQYQRYCLVCAHPQTKTSNCGQLTSWLTVWEFSRV